MTDSTLVDIDQSWAKPCDLSHESHAQSSFVLDVRKTDFATMPMIAESSPWHVLADVAERSQRYLNALGERAVVPTVDALAGLQAFDVPLQSEPMSAERVIDELDAIASPATVAIAGPRYFGFINSGALPAALAANWLSTAWEQHGGFQISSPASTLLEQIALRWVIDLLALPRDCTGSFVTGTTAAHITALAAARDALLDALGLERGRRRIVRCTADHRDRRRRGTPDTLQGARRRGTRADTRH